ncbi:MAG TPA: hypothetical protein ENN65_06870 [Candidatus Hydrogenedentes bacterium]|nr:hypothetical protein [Candidatus Hydrogenedentota bacterium]
MVWLPRITAMVLGILLVLKVILLVLYRFEGWRLHNYLEFEPEILIQEFGHAVSVYFSVILGAGAALAWAALRQRCGEPWFPRREWGRMLYACAAATLISAGAIFGPKINLVVVFV